MKKKDYAAKVGIILAVIAVILALIIYKRQSYKNLITPRSQQPAPSQIEDKIIVIDNKPEVIETVKNVQALQQAYSQNQKMGITAARFNVDNGVINLTIKIKPQVRYCNGGETDTMKRSATDLTKPEFLLTMETIDKNNKPVVAKKYTVNDLEKGDTVSFTAPVPTNKDELYGIFLCHDRENKQSCRDKKVLDYGSLNKYLDPPGKKTDFLYKFHKILVHPDGLVNFFSGMGDKQQFQAISNYLTKDGGTTDKSIQNAENYERHLRDNALSVVDNIIEMLITVGDHSCMPR